MARLASTFLLFLALMASGDVSLYGTDVAVTLQVSLVNPGVPAPGLPVVTEGPLVNALEASDGIVVRVPLSAGTVNGSVMEITLTSPGGTSAIVTQTIIGGDLVAGFVDVAVSANILGVPGTDDGAWQVSATVIASGGLRSPPTVGAGFTLDRVLPGTPSGLIAGEGPILDALAVADGTIIRVALTLPITAGDVITLTIILPGGGTSQVRVTVSAADVVAGEVSVVIPPALMVTDGVYSITAVSSDVAGNVSVASPGVTFTVDHLFVRAPIITAVIADGAVVPQGGGTQSLFPSVRGTALPSTVVRLFDNGVQIATCAVAGDGSWSFIPPTARSIGWHSFVAVTVNGARVSLNSAAYVIDVVGTGRGVDVEGCGTGSWIALVALLGLALGLRFAMPKRRMDWPLALIFVMLMTPTLNAASYHSEDEPTDVVHGTLSAWPAPAVGGSTLNGDSTLGIQAPARGLRLELGWHPIIHPEESSSVVGLSLGVQRIHLRISPPLPGDALYDVRLTAFPLDGVMRWRVHDAHWWTVDVLAQAGGGALFAAIDASTPSTGERFSQSTGLGYTLEMGVGPEIGMTRNGTTLGLSLKAVVAWSQISFNGTAPNAADEHYRISYRQAGLAWGLFVSQSW